MTTITKKMTAQEAYEIALNDPVRRITDKKIIEEAILSNIWGKNGYRGQYLMVLYAVQILNKRWSEAEDFMLNGDISPTIRAELVSSYITSVIKDRWVEAEKVLLNKDVSPLVQAELIFSYATSVIKDRWVEAEKVLVNSAINHHRSTKSSSGACYSNHYIDGYEIVAKYYINLICGYEYEEARGSYRQEGSDNRGRWIEHENILYYISQINANGGPAADLNYRCYDNVKEYWKLAHDAGRCYYHAKNVVKGRWVEGEETIKKHEYWWKMYQELIGGVVESPSSSKNTKLEDLKKARAELDAKIKASGNSGLIVLNFSKEKMMKIFIAFVLMIVACGSVQTSYASDPIKINDDEINKILKAKEIVKGMVKYPDTLVFYEFSTKVSGNTVTLKFTAKNAFGVPETFVKDIKVN